MATPPSERATWWDLPEGASSVSRAIVPVDLAAGATDGLTSGVAVCGSGG
ncbi:MAG TPA: hypothetical protein VMS00_02335 [Acidimicrobiales bacterium]|nr:hypothetical protein [Acidimicrobiales bacterium]